MRTHRPDSLALVAGLVALATGAAGLLGALDLRALDRGWLLPALVVIAGVGILASVFQGRRT